MRAPANPTPSPKAPAPGAPRRIWLYRILAAVAVPAVLLGLLELALRIAGYGRAVRFLVPDETPGYYRTNPDFVSSFLPSAFDLRPLNQRIRARKAPDALRVVVLGESAAQGIPVPAFGFAAQLRAQLRARYPGREIELLNTGIVAINSHVVLQVARELSALSPDLFIIYVGNNEVIGPYGPGCAYLSQMPPLWVIRMSVFVRSTRTGQLVLRTIGRFTTAPAKPQEWGGMSMFVHNAVAGDDPRLEAVYANFEANLRDIVAAASGSGAKTLLCTVVSNLKDCPPLLSLHRPGLPAQDLERWRKAEDRGLTEWLIGEDVAASADLGEALRLDPQYAQTSYLLGRLDLARGDPVSARRRLADALHWDGLRFRPDPRINEAVRRVAREGRAGVVLVDAALALGSDPASPAEPSGRPLLFEHVHFDWEGNYRLARMMAEAAEPLLGRPGTGRWLDAPACAGALGYSPAERMAVLQKLLLIVQNPPFTNQVSYSEDQARLSRELAAATAAHGDPQVLAAARAQLMEAEAADPENPDLPKIEEDLDDARGDVAAALVAARRAEELQPRNVALSGDVAIKLSRLGRFGEAEALLKKAAQGSPARELSILAPAYADFYIRAQRFAEGEAYLERLIQASPGDLGLRLVRGRFLHFAGQDEKALAEFRAVLDAEPTNEPALEERLTLLAKGGRAEAAERECMAAVELQPSNQANDLRAAILFDLRHDADGTLRCLRLAAGSGPVTSAVHLRIAKMLLLKGATEEALLHLGQARRIAALENDPAVEASIVRAVDRIRGKAP